MDRIRHVLWVVGAVPLLAAFFISSFASNAAAQCGELGPLNNFTGAAQTVCPCFIPGEEAGVVLDAPATEYPIEITKIGIAWASTFGGSPTLLEQALHIYAAGLPNPGAPIFTLLGPQLTDGFINEFDITIFPGNKVLNSGPFTVTLEFLNQNAGDIFAPSVVHDGNGCQPGKNVVFAQPGGWNDACLLGVTGDWVMYVKYRSLKIEASVFPDFILHNNAAGNQTKCDTLFVSNDGCDTLTIDSISGCDTAPFSIDTTGTSHSIPPGESTPIVVCIHPTSADPDTCEVTINTNDPNSPLVVPVYINSVTTAVTPTLANRLGEVTVYPNPFNPSTTVQFTLPDEMRVTATVYDVTGRHVRTLARDAVFTAGVNTLHWNGIDQQGNAATSGIYLVRVATPIGSRVTRAVLLK